MSWTGWECLPGENVRLAGREREENDRTKWRWKPRGYLDWSDEDGERNGKGLKKKKKRKKRMLRERRGKRRAGPTRTGPVYLVRHTLSDL